VIVYLMGGSNGFACTEFVLEESDGGRGLVLLLTLMLK